MDILFLILIIIIIIASILLAIYSTMYNQIQDSIIRIDEVEASLDSNLRTKYDLISKSVSIIRSIDENITSDIFDEIVKLRSRKISNFKLDRKLITATDELTILRDKNKEIAQNEDLIRIITQLEEIDTKLDTQREYYNKNISSYNQMIKTFPKRIIALIYKYKEKTYYDRKDMSDDDYDDFKL